jgi:hypothetical protein
MTIDTEFISKFLSISIMPRRSMASGGKSQRYEMELAGQLHAEATLPQGKVRGTHQIEGSEGPRSGLNVMMKEKSLPLLRIELQPSSL